jgi:lysine N6-hydroxylase
MEYNEYCRWVVNQLSSLQFNTTCIEIIKEDNIYHVKTNKGAYLTKHIVLGIGTVPYMPEAAHINHENIFHSSEYLFHKENILPLGSITIIGSGQSAAEIFYDLLQCYSGRLNWFTRSKRFFPMDYSKLTLELSTPDYIDHFFSLPESAKQKTLSEQDSLYKGINQSLISEIYDMLVERNSAQINLHCNCELKNIKEGFNLNFLHTELQKEFIHKTEAVILATGYHSMLPDFIKSIQENCKANHHYSIDDNNSIFIQNAEQSTHGFNGADLGLGPYRNSIILNTILKREQFSLEKNITFQTF